MVVGGIGILTTVREALTIDRYIAFLFKIRYFTIGLWLIGGGTSAAFFMQFISDCSQEFDAPEGTPAYTATIKMKETFPSFVETMDLALFVESTAPAGVLLTDLTANSTQCVKSFLDDVGTKLSNSTEFGPIFESYENYYQLSSVGITSLADRLMDSTARRTLAPVRMWGSFVTKKGMDTALDAENFVKNVANEHDFESKCEASLSVIGVALLVNEALEASAADMGKSDGIVLPIALLVMAVTVKSLRLMILPCVTVGLSLAVSFAIMCGVTRIMTVSSAAPSLMMSLGICMSIDYCLFIVSRYVQEVRKGVTGHKLVAVVVGGAGHTILVSGSTLMLSLIALVFFPLNILQSFGWGCSLTVLIALIVSLTLCPTILLTFPTFFENGARNLVFPLWVPARIVRFLNHQDGAEDANNDSNDNDHPERQRLLAAGSGGDDNANAVMINDDSNGSSTMKTAGSPTDLRVVDRGNNATNLSASPVGSSLAMSSNAKFDGNNHDGDGHADGEEKNTNSNVNPTTKAAVEDRSNTIGTYRAIINGTVFRFLRKTTEWPFNLLSFFLTCCVAGGMGVALMEFHITDSFALNLPRGYTITTAYSRLVDTFGFSYMYPYQILVNLGDVPPADVTARGLLEHHYFNYSQGALRFITGDTVIPGGLKTEDFSGVLAIGGEWVNTAQVDNCLAPFNGTMLSLPQQKQQLSTTTSVALGNTSTTCTVELLSYMMGTVTKSREALLMMLFIRVDPIGNDGDKFYRRLLQLVDVYGEWTRGGAVLDPSSEFYQSQLLAYEVVQYDIAAAKAAGSHVKLYLSGIGPQSMDAVDTVYRLFPIIIAVSAAVVLVVVGFSFRSIVIPIRSVLSIALTELFVFGWVALVYSLPAGVLDWTGAPAVASPNAIPWIDPIVAFSVVLGIALDYDVFLLTRVFELRMGTSSRNSESGDIAAAIEEDGGTMKKATSPLMVTATDRLATSAPSDDNTPVTMLSTYDAILVGLCDTGPIITSAGIIMAIAFLGMLISAMTLLNVLGMFLVTAVLFDTFIVRTFLGPSALSLMGEANWWPRKPAMVPTYFDGKQ